LYFAIKVNMKKLKEKIGNKEFNFRTQEGIKTANFSEMIELILILEILHPI
jgi:hypothetical protein